MAICVSFYLSHYLSVCVILHLMLHDHFFFSHHLTDIHQSIHPFVSCQLVTLCYIVCRTKERKKKAHFFCRSINSNSYINISIYIFLSHLANESNSSNYEIFEKSPKKYIDYFFFIRMDIQMKKHVQCFFMCYAKKFLTI